MIGAAAEDDGSGGKKKRGRPPRGTVRAPVKKKAVLEEEEGEDVCFLCFDGGSLVLCDRRGCPKAYHPACVKRDEAFFQSKAKWNCGWHICSICQKAAHHMCYTCTYSLCKTCTKDADYLSVRGNKGFCATCMRTVMLIENIAPGNKEAIQVDFDDKSSWEYLFKVYWIYLKGKLSLTLDELLQAKKPCKEVVPNARKEKPLDVFRSNSDCKEVVPNARKEKPLDVFRSNSDCKSSISDIPSRHLEVSDSKKRRKKEQLIFPNIEDCQYADKSSNKSSTLSESTEWATKELLEFVAHMRNGDVSVLFPFDVQGLLLEYIKRNNLRDPHRKSQIICDARLMTLFLKPRVGHFEMLKLLEYHFLIKEDSQKEDILGNTIRAHNQVEGGGNNENLLKTDKDKKRKIRKKSEERGLQTNLNEFAAIDVHNVNLIYLRRNLMENLVTANGNFHDKVLGSIVRIRMSSGDLKQDMYRLVQVVGTFKASVPYKIGGKTVDVMLKILNLNKKELVAIDAISNQDFSEEECRRFRQSIKCGFLKRMTVGQVQEKARTLQEVRLNDWLETEILRLNHLRDRASENGRKKELRECVEKIELLKTPEERQRRLHKNPQVHADPKMDPKCESDDDAGEISKQKQADQVKPRRPGFRKLGKDPISAQNKNKQVKFNLDKRPSSRLEEKVHELHKRKEAGVSKAPTISLSTGSPPSAYSETDKLWHYRDPNGKIQGPFCLVQLRKWSTSGYFPPDMMVWSINTEEVESLHLADVLSGNFHKVLPSRSSTSLPYQDRFICEDRHSSTVTPTIVNDSKLSNGSWNCSSATSVHQMIVHEDRRWNSGPTNGNISSDGNTLYPNAGNENQPDSRSGQSFVESWRPSAVNTASNNSGTNFGLGSVTKSSDSPEHLKTNALILPSPTPVTTDTRDIENKISKDKKPSQSCAPVHDLGMEELPSPTPKANERDEKASLGIQNSPIPSTVMIDTDKKVDSSIGNSPSSLPNAKDRDEKVQVTESKPPGANWTSTFSKPTPNSNNDKAGLFAHNSHSPSPKAVDEDEKVNLSIQNVPSPLLNPRDGDDQIWASEINPPVPSLTREFSTPKLSDRDEKAGMGCQNLSSPSPKTVDNVKIGSAIQNMATSSLYPSDGNKKVQANDSKLPGTNITFTSSTAKLKDIDEKAGTSIHNFSSPSPKMVDEDGKVDSTSHNLPSFTLDARGNEKVQANENEPPGTGLACTSIPPMPGDRNEIAGMTIQNIPSPSSKKVDDDGKIDFTVPNLPSSTDGNKKVGANENKPPGTSLTCSSSPPDPSCRNEKAVIGIQNLPTASSNTANGDGEADPTGQKLFNSPLDPEYGKEKVQSDESKPPAISLTCSSSPPDPSCRDEKAVISIQNIPSASPNTDGEADSTDQKMPNSPLDPEYESEKVQSNESKAPTISSIVVSSIAEASDRDEKANAVIQNLQSPSPKMVDGDEKVDSTSCAPNTSSRSEKVEANELEKMATEKPTEMCMDEAVTPASNCDQFAPPSTSNHPCSISDWGAFDYEPIEFTTLGDESVSDLLAEVDAMEAQGDVASPISAIYSVDDFFEDSKGDYFSSIPGMGHLFDFGKNDDVSEPCGPTEYDIFDPSTRSNREASTSDILRVDMRYNHNAGSQAGIGPNNQINSGNTEHNTNSDFGGLTQGMTYMGWGNPGLTQVNMDTNQNT